jgi:hypothetical protein
MVLVLFMLLASVPTAPAADKEAPKLKCEIDNPLRPGKMREATPREAGRLVAKTFRVVSGYSNNQTLKPNWLIDFANCLEVSGLSVADITSQPNEMRQFVLRTFISSRERMENDAEDLDMAERLESYRVALNKMKVLFPDMASELDGFRINKPEADDLLSRRAAVLKEKSENCSPVDISNRLGMVRNQTDIGWCYAFSAADLVTFKLGNSNAHMDRRISAADIAFLHNRVIRREDFTINGTKSSEQEAGWMGNALRSALQNGGFCWEKDAPSEDLAFGDIKESIAQIEGFKEQSFRQGFSPEGLCFAYRQTLELFPGLKLVDFQRILNRMGDRNFEFFAKLGDANCRADRSPHDIKKEDIVEQFLAGSSGEAIRKTIDEQLDKKNISSIGFQFKMITKKTNETGQHAVTIVGRRFNKEKNTCEYLLRNSWGIGCSESIKPELCAKDHEGHLWVSRDSLESNITNVTYIK